MSDACARSTTENGTETTNLNLSRRAVACKAFRWLPGMLDVHGGRVVSVEGGMLRLDYRDDDDPIRTSASACLPDLTDPATLGCLLFLVRAAWGDPHASSRWMKPEWKVLVQRMGYINYTVVGVGRTEAEALVAALEAAP